jgi:hypothetical protein
VGAVAKVGIVTTGGSEAEKALASVAESIDAAAKQVGKIDKSLDSGRGNIARYAVTAEAEFEKVRAAIASGVEVTDEQREALEKLEGELETAKGRAREYNDALGDMKAQTGEVRNAHDAFAATFPKLAEGVGKGLIAMAALKESYQGTREIVKFLNDELGINIDKWIAESGPIKNATEALAGYRETAEQAAETEADFAAAREHAAEVAAAAAETTKEATKEESDAAKTAADSQAAYAASIAQAADAGDKAADGGVKKLTDAVARQAEKFDAAKAEAEGLARTLDYVFTYGDRAKAADDKAAEAKARNADATKELEAAEAELAKLRALTTLDPAQQARLDELESGLFMRQETARRLAQEQLRWEQEAAQLRKRQTDEESQNHATAAKSQGAVVDQLTAQAEAAGKLGEALAAMNTEWSRAVDLAGQFMAILGGGAKAAGSGGATP